VTFSAGHYAGPVLG